MATVTKFLARAPARPKRAALLPAGALGSAGTAAADASFTRPRDLRHWSRTQSDGNANEASEGEARWSDSNVRLRSNHHGQNDIQIIGRRSGGMEFRNGQARLESSCGPGPR